MRNIPRTKELERCVHVLEQRLRLPRGTNRPDCRRADEGMDLFGQPNDLACVRLFLVVIEQ